MKTDLIKKHEDKYIHIPKKICKNCGECKQEHCEGIDKLTNKKVLVCMKYFWRNTFNHKRGTFFEELNSEEAVSIPPNPKGIGYP